MTEQPQWRFLENPKGAKARDPMQDEFFQDQSIDGIGHALIRETIQNSLDARESAHGAPVKVVISLGSLTADRANFWFPAEIKNHYAAKEIKLSNLPNWGMEECTYLTIEDFGTKGLEGKVDSETPQEGGNFYHFFRAEGLSNKKEGERGSWGVGKIVIPRASRVRSFFAMTQRASDKGMHLIGQTILRHHELDGKRYTPDGWFSKDKNGLQVPFTSDFVTNQLMKDFRLSRNNELGLSVVIPWIYKEYLTLEILSTVIAKEYFIPILAGDLVVELKDHSSDIYQRFDASCAEELKKTAPNDDQLQDAIQLASCLLRLGQNEPLEVKVAHESGSDEINYNWNSYRTEVPSQDIESELDHGRVVHFKVPMTIKAADKSHVEATFDVLIKRKPGRHYPLYIRDGLVIPNQPTRKKTPDSIALIYCADNAISGALRQAECPAHTDWKASRDKFKEQRYRSANLLIPFVRESAHKLIEKLSTEDEKPDHNLLADLLPHPSSNSFLQPSNNIPLSDRNKKERTTKSDHPSIPPSTPRCWKLKQSQGKINLTGNYSGFTNGCGYRLTLQVAYDIHGRNPFKAHSKYDFNLKQAAENGTDNITGFQVAIRGAEIESGDYGRLVILVKNPDFEVILQPADLNRDLIIKVNSAPIGESSYEDEEITE
ncbi:hypothetical protein [Aeromonas veronii]|uniref:hypothetical protein n=1 Tax=Aeromonas veronii TaxID=654 RepID=UPI001F3438D7|nr:hypothetical protein [Aeromonas veronii]MCF5873826.1 hypothetical protein [Aeromonas veronii]